jgi:HEAT repeat protein
MGSMGHGVERQTTERSMRSFIPAIFRLSILSMLAFGAGCGESTDPRAGREIPRGKLPPGFPVSKDVPLDQKLKAAADQELVKALHDADPNVRAHAIEAARESTGDAHAKEFIAALSDPNPLVVYSAGLAAGDLRLKDAQEPLLRLIDHKDSGVRVVARYALHCLGHYKYSHDLEELAKDPQPSVRGTTAMVLGMIGDPSAINVLKPLRRDVYPAVRQQADVSLWQLGNSQGLSDLIGMTVSPYQDDKKVVLLGLAAPHNRNVIQHIRTSLTDDAAEVALVAARAMGMLGCDEGYGVAQRGIKSEDPRQRVLAALAFGAIGRADAQGMLRKLLTDANADVRVAAAEAILQLKPHFTDECSTANEA